MSKANIELRVYVQELKDESIRISSSHEIDKFKIKKDYEIYRHFDSKSETHWTLVSKNLPLDLLGPYRLKIIATASPIHIPESAGTESHSIRIANLSLSKDCFAKEGKSTFQ